MEGYRGFGQALRVVRRSGQLLGDYKWIRTVSVKIDPY
jgi:hypothetical protein